MPRKARNRTTIIIDGVTHAMMDLPRSVQSIIRAQPGYTRGQEHIIRLSPTGGHRLYCVSSVPASDANLTDIPPQAVRDIILAIYNRQNPR